MIDNARASAQRKAYINCREVWDRLPSRSIRNPDDPRRLGDDGEMGTRRGWLFGYGVKTGWLSSGSLYHETSL